MGLARKPAPAGRRIAQLESNYDSLVGRVRMPVLHRMHDRALHGAIFKSHGRRSLRPRGEDPRKNQGPVAQKRNLLERHVAWIDGPR